MWHENEVSAYPCLGVNSTISTLVIPPGIDGYDFGQQHSGVCFFGPDCCGAQGSGPLVQSAAEPAGSHQYSFEGSERTDSWLLVERETLCQRELVDRFVSPS